MQPRPGLARLLPLLALTGLVVGALALLATERRAPAPAVRYDCGCSHSPAPVPAQGVAIVANGRAWDHSGMPLRTVKWLHLRSARCAGMDLHAEVLIDCDFGDADLTCANLIGALFLDCDFRGANLRCADLRGSFFHSCDFGGAHMDGAALEGAAFDPFTRWPTGFDPTAHGVRQAGWRIQ